MFLDASLDFPWQNLVESQGIARARFWQVLVQIRRQEAKTVYVYIFFFWLNYLGIRYTLDLFREMSEKYPKMLLGFLGPFRWWKSQVLKKVFWGQWPWRPLQKITHKNSMIVCECFCFFLHGSLIVTQKTFRNTTKITPKPHQNIQEIAPNPPKHKKQMSTYNVRVYIYIYICMCIYMCVYIHIYIYLPPC